MPWAPDGVALDETVGERTVIVGAMGADGEEVLPLPNENGVLLSNASRERNAILEVLDANASGQVGLGGVDVSHESVLLQID
jgi:hypothetical protein